MGFTSEYNEMIADVVADIRNQARVFHDAAKLYGEFILTDYADRLEAAEKRERGNVAVLQSKALDKVKEAYEILVQWEADEAAGVAGTTDKPEAKSASEALFAARMILQEALRFPPRNCDIGTPDEQGVRCLATMRHWRKAYQGDALITAIMKWGQEPYTAEEGAGK